jgi:DUF1365 family protein
MKPRYFVHGQNILGIWYILDRQQSLDHAAADARTDFGHCGAFSVPQARPRERKDAELKVTEKVAS